MQLVNIKTNRIRACAFCKHWYDPTNAALKPRNPMGGFWEYDQQMKAPCAKRLGETHGSFFCSKFEMKL